MDPEEEAAERGSSGDDEFYDRTEEGRRKRAKEGAAALDAAQLYGRKVRARDAGATNVLILALE